MFGAVLPDGRYAFDKMADRSPSFVSVMPLRNKSRGFCARSFTGGRGTGKPNRSNWKGFMMMDVITLTDGTKIACRDWGEGRSIPSSQGRPLSGDPTGGSVP